MGIELRTSGGVAEVVIDYPPVNALPVAGWFDLADAIAAAGDDPSRRGSSSSPPRGAASTPASTSRRCSRPRASTALIGANRGCYAAFAAVYECAVPVIAAVHGFCLGGGIGLVGNADIIVAATTPPSACPRSTAARSAPPPTWPGWCPSTRCAPWSTPAETVTAAASCTRFGSVLDVVPPRELRAAALEVAGEIAAKEPDRHPAGQGVAERHRPGRRQAQLPLRAGLHLRAQPLRRLRRGPRRLRRRAER